MTFAVNQKKYYHNKERVRVACAKSITRVKLPLLFMQRRAQWSQRRTLKKRSPRNKMVTQLLRLKKGMKEIRVQQSCIKAGQRQVKEKFEAIESECETLRSETLLIMRQSAWTQLRLAIMFQILKARENKDFARAAKLTNALRELIGHQNQNGQALEPSAEAKGEINGK